MTNTFPSGLLGSRPAFDGLPEVAESNAQSVSSALLANLITDLVSWVGCLWASAMSRIDGELRTLHVAGLVPNTGVARFTIPIQLRGETYYLAFGPKKSDAEYTETDRTLILDAATHVSTLLGNQSLASFVAADLTRMHQIRTDLETARNVQSRLFPVRLPAVPGLDYFGECRPASDVGGDFFDFVTLQSTELAISVGDVSGHGIGSAILMSGLQASLRGLTANPGEDTAAIVRELNRRIYDTSPDNFFATLFYARIDPKRKMLRYVSAGHDASLIIREGGIRVERLESTGTVLGLADAVRYEQRSVMFRPGDTLVALTDGVSEPNCEAALIDMIRRHDDDRASDLVWRILDAAARCNGPREADDKTVAVVRFTQPSIAPWCVNL